MDEIGPHGELSLEPQGETTVLLRIGNRLDIALNARVHALAADLYRAELPGVLDIVPAYASLALHYDPAEWVSGTQLPWRNFADAVRTLLTHASDVALPVMAAIEIPVCYGHEHGPDLEDAARHCELTADEVVRRHAAGRYRVAMLGFAPGFPYLLGLDPTLHMPRRSNPRTRVRAGSVAIGGAQTGIYPSDLPGGWQIIGSTPLRLFDPLREPACLLGPGDLVRFIGIDEVAFDELMRASAP